jgi:gluconolactonase
MNIRILRPASLLAASLICAYGQQAQAPATDTAAPDIPGVVKGGTKVQVIKEGFQGTEGPIGMRDGSLIFTETNASRITKIDKDGKTSTFLENTNGSNGLAFDSKGRLISVQTTPGKTQIGVIYPKGSEKMLVDNFEGKPFGRPNDLVVSSKGAIYFTDPANVQNPPLPPAVYYAPPEGGKAVKVAENINFPNGLTLSRDEKILYVNDARGPNLLAFDVKPDGTLSNRRDFAKYEVEDGTRSGADGLALDAQGRLYAATSAGIEVFAAEGKHLGTIKLSRIPQNLAFAGPDKKTLYVVGRGAAFKIDMLTSGFKGRAK